MIFVKINLDSEMSLSGNKSPKTQLKEGRNALVERLEKVIEPVKKEIELKTPNEVKCSAAMCCFTSRIDEFVKNSLDAGATWMSFAINWETPGDALIQIRDNGKMERVSLNHDHNKAIKKYDYEKAFLSSSGKKGSKLAVLGGANKGLSMIAHYLSALGGFLEADFRDDGSGFEVNIISSAEKAAYDFIQYESEFTLSHLYEEGTSEEIKDSLSRLNKRLKALAEPHKDIRLKDQVKLGSGLDCKFFKKRMKRQETTEFSVEKLKNKSS